MNSASPFQSSVPRRHFLPLLFCAAAMLLPTRVSFGGPPHLLPAPKAIQDNAATLRAALAEAPEAQRADLAFLLENMPARDLRTLSADFLLADIAEANAALRGAPWLKDVPQDIFLNHILPYANASEKREAWRASLRARCLPLITGCATPSQGAQRLNETLFKAADVRYSTARARADQSPSETLQSGLASCTGLSILLVDACRSVGIPARLVGIPDWSDGRGNHTWVEIWDAGKWHFLGAAEPDGRGLDHAWFERDAALAQKDNPRHAIYAVSFRRTGLPFPLAWGPDSGGVDAENVTERYTAQATPVEATTTRVMIRVRDGVKGPRIVAAVQVVDEATPPTTRLAKSKGEDTDTNDMLTFDLPRGQNFTASARAGGRSAETSFATGQNSQQIVELSLDASTKVPGAFPDDLTDEERQLLRPVLTGLFSTPPGQQDRWEVPEGAQALLRTHPAAARRFAWEEYRHAPIHAEARMDFAENRVRFGQYLSPYTLRPVGTKPAAGWGVVVAMHGGGGAPKELNDSQWRGMERHYRDQPDLGGYLYVALRAPNDTWNGFYDDYVYPLVEKLLRQFAVCEDVDLDRVFILGYSHGGYGAFAIGPKMPDRFAAIHSSAAAPTDGLISPKTLRHANFSFTVGEFDDTYGRRTRCEAFDRDVQALKGSRTDLFPVTFNLEMGRHHSDLPDRDQLRLMLPNTRDAVPRDLTWEQTDGVVQSFYWLEDEHPAKSREIDADCRGNILRITAHPAEGDFAVLLDERLIDSDKPLTIEHDGQKETCSLTPDLRTLCETMLKRGDPALAFSCRLHFETTPDGKVRLVEK